MTISPNSKKKNTNSLEEQTPPAQTNLSGMVDAINLEMQNLQADPANFFESLMGATSQFDGFLNTISFFLSAAHATTLSTSFMACVQAYDALNAKFQKDGTIDTKTLNSLIAQWTALFPKLNQLQMTTTQFFSAVGELLDDVKFAIPNMPTVANAAFKAYGEIACLSDAKCFFSQTAPDNINLPQLDNVFEDLNTIINVPQNRDAALQALANTDLPALQALYPD